MVHDNAQTIQHSNQHRENDDAHVFSIIGFILPFVGMAIPGLIFSIIAYRQQKKAGDSYKLALAGIWIGAFFTLLLIAYFVFVGIVFVTHLHGK